MFIFSLKSENVSFSCVCVAAGGIYCEKCVLFFRGPFPPSPTIIIKLYVFDFSIQFWIQTFGCCWFSNTKRFWVPSLGATDLPQVSTYWPLRFLADAAASRRDTLSCFLTIFIFSRSYGLPVGWDLHLKAEKIQSGDVCGHSWSGGRRHDLPFWC